VFSDLPDLAATPATDDGRVFQVGDWVTIYYVVTNAPLSHEERIKEDGTITLPQIGPISVAGKTSGELQRELQQKYPKYFSWYRPEPGPYFVFGEVKQAGPKAFLGETTLTKAIQAAGGFTDFANKKKIKLTHPDGQNEIVNVLELSKDPSLDRRVLPGDLIFVPRRVGFGF